MVGTEFYVNLRCLHYGEYSLHPEGYQALRIVAEGGFVRYLKPSPHDAAVLEEVVSSRGPKYHWVPGYTVEAPWFQFGSVVTEILSKLADLPEKIYVGFHELCRAGRFPEDSARVDLFPYQLFGAEDVAAPRTVRALFSTSSGSYAVFDALQAAQAPLDLPKGHVGLMAPRK